MQKYDALLVGFYGMRNTGDDMLMAAAAAGARQRFDAKHIAATAAKNSEAPLRLGLSNIQSSQQRFRGQDRLLKYWAAKRSKHIIIGGGSVLHTAKDIHQKRQYLQLAQSNQHIAAGVGIGPFVDNKAEKACADFLNACSFTGLRDHDSYDIARSIAPNANIALTFDLAPGLRYEPEFVSALAEQRQAAIGVALCPVERFVGREDLELARLKSIAAALRKFCAEQPHEIRLIDFNGHDELGDQQVHQQLKALLGDLPCKVIDYHANPYTAIHEISKLSGILAMRLHAAIFAYLSETPCIALNYHPKCHNWCRDIGQAAEFASDSGQIDQDWLYQRLLNISSNNYISPKLDIAEACRKAQLNWNHAL